MQYSSQIVTRPHLVLGSLLRVRRITKHIQPRGRTSFTLLLAGRAARYVAIAGEAGARLSVGDLVHVRGCFLRRVGRYVLVVSSVERIAHRGLAVRRQGFTIPDLRKTIGGGSR